MLNAPNLGGLFQKLMETDGRFNGKDPRFGLAEEELGVFHKSLRENLNVHKEDVRQLGCLLAGLIKRRAINEGGIVQVYGHVEQIHELSCLKEEITSGSLYPSLKNTLDEPVNLASLISANTGKVISTRSGRTDSVAKILKKSLFDIHQRLRGASKFGLKKLNGEDRYLYQRVDQTYLSDLKNKGCGIYPSTIVKGDDRPSEQTFLNNKKDAYNCLWPKENTLICHQLNVKGKKITVLEKRPILIRHIFSSESKSKDKQNQALQDNKDSILKLCLAVLARVPPVAQVKKLIGNIREGRNISRALAGLIHNATGNSKLALRGILVNLTGKCEKGLSYDLPEDQARLSLFIDIATNFAGLASSKECKSGNDRGPTGATAHVVLERFGGYFDISKPKELTKKFRKQFAKDCIHFIYPNLAASRAGQCPRLKVSNNPAFRALIAGYSHKLKRYMKI